MGLEFSLLKRLIVPVLRDQLIGLFWRQKVGRKLEVLRVSHLGGVLEATDSLTSEGWVVHGSLPRAWTGCAGSVDAIWQGLVEIEDSRGEVHAGARLRLVVVSADHTLGCAHMLRLLLHLSLVKVLRHV